MSADSDTNSKTMMSADIVGSTALYEALGDNAARAMVTACLDALKRLCIEHHGRALAEVGDQVIAEFDDPTEAAGTASEIHLQLHEQYANDPGVPVRMRIGLHYGPVPTSGDVLSGETVKIANWASDNAKPEQTLATRALIDQLPRIFRAVSRYVDDETWNFISIEHVELYEIIWDVESITAYNGEQPARDENSYDRVVFDYENEQITVNVARPVISIGRHKENDLVIDKDLVSRQHLSAQFSRGRCTITDNSTNGSVIKTSAGKRYQIKRESFRLTGSGVIIAGMPGQDDAGFEISFHCE